LIVEKSESPNVLRELGKIGPRRTGEGKSESERHPDSSSPPTTVLSLSLSLSLSLVAYQKKGEGV